MDWVQVDNRKIGVMKIETMLCQGLAKNQKLESLHVAISSIEDYRLLGSALRIRSLKKLTIEARFLVFPVFLLLIRVHSGVESAKLLRSKG